MFLKRLEVFGFKSFAERLDISFSNGITAIVGPNGSGKSNVSDAVRWVLGEQSAKQLRGANMADVIFKGTDSRKPLSYCEVSLVFDNQDKGLDIEYSEVVITRRLYRSGESEYYINRNGCRLKDIVSLFQDTGIGKEGYSIVGQGKIEDILSGKQEQRRSVFEEAAGIVKYKTRKLEAERKLEHTSENLVRIKDIIDTLEERIEPLSQQADTAKEYISLREQLRTLEVNFFLVQNELAQQRREQFNAQLEGLDHEKEEKTSFANSIALENEQLDADLAEKENQLSQIRAKILELTAAGENISGQQRVLNERITNINAQLERISADIENTDKRKQSMLDSINGDKNAEQEKESAISAKNDEIDSLEKELELRETALENERNSLESIKAEMMANINKLSDVKSNISRCEAMKVSIGNRKEKISAAVEQIRAQRTNIQDALDQQRISNEAFEKEKNKLLLAKDNLVSERNELYSQKENAAETLASAKSQIDSASSRLKVLEELKNDYEGFNFSVKKLLKKGKEEPSFNSHICGVLAELINVDAKLETAIEAALGAAMQNIVTPTEQDAKFLIDFLRRTDSGRATFLPVSAVKSRSVTEQERSALKINGCFGIASELVKFDKAYSGVIGSLLGRTIIVDNLNTGISIAQKTNHALKIVTLEGDVMNAGGSMSGGSMRSRSSSILGRDREIADVKKLLEQKRDEIKKTNDILSRFSAYCMEIDQKLANVDDELHRLDVDFARDIEKLKSLENDMQASVNSENELLTENEQLDDTLKEIETELDNISRMQGDFENSNTDAQAQINARQYEFNKKQLEKDKLAQQLTDAKIEYAGLEKELDAMRNNKARMAELIENLEKTKLSLIGEGKKLELQLEQTVKEQNESVSGANETSLMLDTYSKTEKESQAERDRINAKIRDNEEKRRRFEQDVFDAGERRHKIELSLSKLDSDLSYLENRLWEEYELTQATAEELKDPDFKMTGAQSEINKLKKAISALGNVNVNAIEEYIETKERFDSLSNQRDDLVKAEEDLNKIIDELTKKMDKQFREQFELINKYFTQTFSELFGGGRAELKLENGENSLESDIEIVAQPPGKSLQLLSLLSGGERALTAIAILFAMLKLKPTPFCILDEIEAALDEANVGNFASYLRKFSNDTQFIVITHRKPTMEEADSLYGVAMEEKGVSKIVSVKLT